MKKILIILLLLNAGWLSVQTSPNIIDFEPGNFDPNNCGVTYSHNEGDHVDMNYFFCAYGIEFFSGTPNRTVPFSTWGNPLGGFSQRIIIEVGGTNPNTDGLCFAHGTPTAYSSANGCSPTSTDNYDTPNDNLDFGCFFLTASCNSNTSFYIQSNLHRVITIIIDRCAGVEIGISKGFKLGAYDKPIWFITHFK